jgi:ribonuclease HII
MYIRKPYVEFDFDSLAAYGNCEKPAEQTGVKRIKDDNGNLNHISKNIKTDPVQFGSSVNIRVPSMSKIMLPVNSDFWPTLSCRVLNYILPGLLEPVIGYFSINLNDALKRTDQLKKRYFSKERRVKYE